MRRNHGSRQQPESTAQDRIARLRADELQAQKLHPGSVWWEHRRSLNKLLVAESDTMVEKVSDEDDQNDDDDDDDEARDEKYEAFVPCSAIPWSVAQSIYEFLLLEDPASFGLSRVAGDNLESLLGSLQTADAASRSVFDISVAKNRAEWSIQQIILHVVPMLQKGTLRLRISQFLASPLVLAKGAPTITFKRNGRIDLVLVVAHDLFDGQASAFVLMDVALAKNEERGTPTDSMYGIITDYSRWVFVKRTAKGIKWCREFITQRTHDADVARVAGRLHAILKETGAE
jgi:hypothetical protein